jgi:D-galactarolactone cycloisomerase
MKIVAVTPHVLSTPLEEPFALSRGWVERRGALVVEVATDEGKTGWGRLCATGCSRPRSPPPLSSTTSGRCWSGVTRSTSRCFGRRCTTARPFGGGAAVNAISGFDVAL